MLESMVLKNFTAFSHADLTFAPGLNVFVGENGTGKTHILKAAYAVLKSISKEAGFVPGGPANATVAVNVESEAPSKSYLQATLANKLITVFRPDELGRLARKHKKPGRQRSEVNCRISGGVHLDLSFHTSSKSEVTIEKTPSTWLKKPPVYVPTRELLTIQPNFATIYLNYRLPFDETWFDTCVLLGAPLARGPRENEIKKLLEPLEEALGGKILDNKAGGFKLKTEGDEIEMHLVAEGLRKFAMIARLIATGSLADKSVLFWDEPEANLNPKLIKVVARTILELSKAGIQIFIATHSLFLMRELDILMLSKEFAAVKSRFFGLHKGTDGVEVMQGESVDDIGEIDALQEELSQSDRYLETEPKK